MISRSNVLTILAIAVWLAGCGETAPVLSDMDGGTDAGPTTPGSDSGPATDPDAGHTPGSDGGQPMTDSGPTPDPDAGAADPDAGPPPPACGDETVTSPSDPTVGSWASRFNLPGLGGSAVADALAMAVGPTGVVYAGGTFSHAGNVPANNVASWTSTGGWEPMGSGIEGDVYSIAADPGGSVVWAAAQMYDSGDTVLWRWDGASWASVTTAGGLGRIDDLQVDAEGKLYVAGIFEGIGGVETLNNFAVYDGTTWSALGGNPDRSVSGILLDSTGVCIGGMFENVGDTPAQNVACWDGSTWTPYDLPHAFYEVKVLARDADGRLLAGGHFTLDPEDSSRGGSLARWNGTAWEYVGDGVHSLEGAPGYIEGIAVVGADIYVGGYFNAVGLTRDEQLIRDVARWDGTRWHDLGGAERHMGIGLIEQNVRRVVADESGNVYIGGMFSVVGSISAGHVAMWDGSYWSNMDTSQVSAGVNGVVNALAVRGDCGVYVGGDFQYAGDIVANDVARLDESGWHPLGNGLNGYVAALAIDSQGRLYAGGNFVGPGFYHLARWDGTSWSGVGNTMGGVTALAIDQDDRLYVGGEFAIAGDVEATNIAMYDGTSWHALGEGLDGPPHAMTFADDGSLVVVGRFENAGGAPAANIARWDDSTWSTYGEGLPGSNGLRSVGFYGGQLVAGGGFDALEDGGKGVAVWDGTSWSSVGGGLHTRWSWSSPYVNALIPVAGRLFAIGDFAMAEGEDSVRAAYYDGSTWHPMGAGLDDFAEEAVLTSEGIWMGGTFTKAGDTPSVGVALWRFAP